MATIEQLQNYYVNLLIIQYINKPRAREHIEVLARAAIMDLLPLEVRDGFDIDTAVGVQLDVIGQYIGLSRNGRDFSGFVTLDDDDYRTALQLKTLQNNGGSSTYEIQTWIQEFFPEQIIFFDFQNMRIGYFLNTSIGDQTLVEFFLMQNLLPKPMAVQLSTTIYADVIDGFYGFRTYKAEAVNNSPFNTYDNYEMDRPWLSYEDALIIP